MSEGSSATELLEVQHGGQGSPLPVAGRGGLGLDMPAQGGACWVPGIGRRTGPPTSVETNDAPKVSPFAVQHSTLTQPRISSNAVDKNNGLATSCYTSLCSFNCGLLCYPVQSPSPLVSQQTAETISGYINSKILAIGVIRLSPHPATPFQGMHTIITGAHI